MEGGLEERRGWSAGGRGDERATSPAAPPRRRAPPIGARPPVDLRPAFGPTIVFRPVGAFPLPAPDMSVRISRLDVYITGLLVCWFERAVVASFSAAVLIEGT